MSAWESTRTPSLRKSASCSIIALRNNSESPILSSSATVHSPSVDWSLLKEPHGGRLRQRPLPFTHSRGHYPWTEQSCLKTCSKNCLEPIFITRRWSTVERLRDGCAITTERISKVSPHSLKKNLSKVAPCIRQSDSQPGSLSLSIPPARKLASTTRSSGPLVTNAIAGAVGLCFVRGCADHADSLVFPDEPLHKLG